MFFRRALVISAVFIGLALWHFQMALGSPSEATGAIPSVDGKPLFVLTRFATVCVGVFLVFLAVLVAAVDGILSVPIPAQVLTWLYYGLAVGLFALAVGEFKYVGFFKRIRGSQFAKIDTFV